MSQARKELEEKLANHYQNEAGQGGESAVALLEGNSLRKVLAEHERLQKENRLMKSWIDRNEIFVPSEERELLANWLRTRE